MKRVQFTEVGRDKVCWIAEMESLDELSLYKAVRKKGAAGPRHV